MRSWKIFITLLMLLIFAPLGDEARDEHNPSAIKKWKVPWERTRPREPYVNKDNRTWLVRQTRDYLAVLDPKVGQFHQFELNPGTDPHNCIVDEKGLVWYAGNRAAHIGTLNSTTGDIIKYEMHNSPAHKPTHFSLENSMKFALRFNKEIMSEN